MATYFVDSVNGNDTFNGLGPDASAGTNKPWKTIAKALGASGIASGDTVYLSPAGPFRETVTVNMTPAAETKVLGDPGNAQGFKTSGGVTVASGPIIWTNYLTNDKTAATATAIISPNSKSFLTFQYIQFVSGSNNSIAASGTATHDMKFTDCAFILCGSGGSASAINIATTTNVAANYTIDRCYFYNLNSNSLINVSLATITGADLDYNIAIRNSVFFQGVATSAITVTSSGALANKGGGVKIRNCTFHGPALIIASASVSTTIPCIINNCLILCGNSLASLSANTLGQITEDYNLIYSATPRTNVNVGAHSISDRSYAALFHFGQERIWGMLQRPFGEPMAGSPILGFGNDGTQTSYDGLNRPRPAGGASASPAAGALERGNTAAQGTSPAPPLGTYSWQGTGPWYQDFQVPVDTTATTISVYVRRDGSYTGTAPQMLILAQPEIGVSGQTITDANPSGQWNTITAAPFTPTGAGVVTVRVYSGDTSGVSVVEFADFSFT